MRAGELNLRALPTSIDAMEPNSGSAHARLTGRERALAGAFALVAFAAAALLLWNPPHIDHVAEIASCKTAATCQTKVSADVSTIVLALVAIAGVAALVALLGVRFNSIKVAGNELGQTAEQVPDTQKPAGDIEKLSGATEAAPGAATAPETQVWDRLDEWVQQGLLDWRDRNPAVVTAPLSRAVTEAVKAAGQGNHPWFVTLTADTGDSVVVRVSTGKGAVKSREYESP